MIVVLSYDFYEQGTDPVIDWLLYYKASFVKITIQDLLSKKTDYLLDVNNGRIWIKGRDVTDDIKVIWYRRFEDDIRLNLGNDKHSKQVLFELQNEISELIRYLSLILKDKVWMPTYSAISLNKLETLYYANKHGLKIPATIVTNSKQQLTAFYTNSGGYCITKPINHSGYFIDNELTYNIYTNKITDQFLEAVPDNFITTLFQEGINKVFEIRVFYLDGNFYSSAIIVEDENDECDIKLNFESNNINWVPYQLPTEYEAKLDMFLKDIGLNTCSMDIFKTETGDYVLIEINTVGQYLAPSRRSNYNLEEKIAKWLIKNDEKEKINF